MRHDGEDQVAQLEPRGLERGGAARSPRCRPRSAHRDRRRTRSTCVRMHWATVTLWLAATPRPLRVGDGNAVEARRSDRSASRCPSCGIARWRRSSRAEVPADPSSSWQPAHDWSLDGAPRAAGACVIGLSVGWSSTHDVDGRRRRRDRLAHQRLADELAAQRGRALILVRELRQKPRLGQQTAARPVRGQRLVWKVVAVRPVASRP